MQQQLDPRSVWLFFASYVIRWLFISIIFCIYASTLIMGISQNERLLVPAILTISFFFLPLFSIMCFVWAKLSYKYYRYELTEDGFKKEYGVIYKRYVTIPYDRVQNVDIFRGILARFFGLSDLQIQTAGSSTPGGYKSVEGRLPGLTKEAAEQLRDELIKRAKTSKNQGI